MDQPLWLSEGLARACGGHLRPASIHHKPWEASLNHPPHQGHALALLLGLLAKTSELLLRPFGFRKFINLSFSSIFGYLVHMSVDSSETIVSEMSMPCEDFSVRE